MTAEHPMDPMQRAHLLAQSGDLKGAAQLCRAVLAQEPSHFYALFMLGSIQSGFSAFDDAAKHLKRAVELQPHSPEALTSYGNVLLELKRYEEGQAVLNKAIALQPQNTNALIYRGLGLAETGRHEEALKDFDRVLQLDARSVFALHNRANALIALNRHKDARPSVDALLRIAPNYVPALSTLALVFMAEKKYREALTVADRAISLEAGNPSLIAARGDALMALKRCDEALASYDKAAAIKPEEPGFQISRGNALSELGRHDDALGAYRRALALKPDSVEAHLNCANVLMGQNRLNEALAACDNTLALKPDYAAGHVLRGNLLLHLGRADEAFPAYDRAVAAKPDYAEAHYHRGSALLLHGRMNEGWRDFAHRWNVADCGFDRPNLRGPEWQGEPLQGRSIVVYSEQGLGDAIQFVRFLPRLTAMGAKVTFLCHPNLVRLFRPLTSGMEVTAVTNAHRSFDFQCALMTLAERFDIGPDDLPGNVPYLFAEQPLVAAWKDRIGESGFKIGICWQGNPAGKIDKGRSVPLEKFRPFGDLPGVRLISLQKTHGLDQLTRLPPGMKVETLGAFDEGQDAFIDTAAIMQNLDLVITSDTSIAHLAGALARPSWVAVKQVPDWRWMLKGSHMPWYPTMRLFRQPARDDWDAIFAEMTAQLRLVLEGKESA
jgi:tetratricopeptide (TPR) repeat protein